MAGFKIWTDLDVDKTYRLCRRVAEEMEFAVRPIGERAFSAKKGSLLIALLMAPYCSFEVFVEDLKGETEIRIERNMPWWTGVFGVQLVTKRARDLATGITNAIAKEDGKVLREKEF